MVIVRCTNALDLAEIRVLPARVGVERLVVALQVVLVPGQQAGTL